MNNAISRGIEILRLVGNSKESLTIADMSRQLDIPKTTVFNIVNTLVEEKCLSLTDRRLKSYSLGVGVFEIGTLYSNKMELTKIAAPLMEELASKISETVFLAVVNNYELVYVNKRESTHPLRTTADLGSRMPMYTTSLGKAILATYSPGELEDYFQHVQLIPRTRHTITEKARLLEELKAIRNNKCALDNEENEEGIFCVGAPIFNSGGKARAALSISTMRFKINDDVIQMQKENIVKAALEISNRQGYPKGTLF